MESFFGGTITPHWKYYFDKSRKGFLSENLFVIELKFYRTNNSYINEVCDMDIDEFVQKAQTLGYIQYPLNRRNFAIPGIVLKRDNLALHIEEVVALSPNEKRCIARIIIDREF